MEMSLSTAPEFDPGLELTGTKVIDAPELIAATTGENSQQDSNYFLLKDQPVFCSADGAGVAYVTLDDSFVVPF